VELWCFRVGVVLVLPSGAKALESEACHGFKACWVKAQNPYHL